LKKCVPRITSFDWNLVDKPWDFYSIRYTLDDYMDHVVYIPAVIITEELKTKSIVDIVVERLRAELACTPVHHLRVTKAMKDATTRSAINAARRPKKRKLA
jgi:hypothetical protein